MTVPLLEARGLCRAYGKLPVLKSVDLTLRSGDRHVVIGPNGAGKTTLFKVLTGELLPEAGTISFDGRRIEMLPAWKRVQLGFGRSFQVARVFPHMSVLENVVVAVEARLAAGGGRVAPFLAVRPTRAVVDEAMGRLDQLGLAAVSGEEAHVLSHGDRKRLELAVGLALKPCILVLDEPTAGMSPSDRADAVRLIARLACEHDITLLLSEHDMSVVFGLGTVLTVLHHGEVIASGTPEEVRRDPVIRDIYLGREARYA